MSMRTDPEYAARFRRLRFRRRVQSVFWTTIQYKKENGGYRLQALADALKVTKSVVSRMFGVNRQNWTLDKLSDLADALGVDLVIEARDRSANVTHTASGTIYNQAHTIAQPGILSPEAPQPSVQTLPARTVKVPAHAEASLSYVQ